VGNNIAVDAFIGADYFISNKKRFLQNKKVKGEKPWKIVEAA